MLSFVQTNLDKLFDLVSALVAAGAIIVAASLARRGKKEQETNAELNEKQASHEQAESDSIYLKMALDAAEVNRKLVAANSEMLSNAAEYRRQISELQAELKHHAEQIRDLYEKMSMKDDEIARLKRELEEAEAKLKDCFGK